MKISARLPLALVYLCFLAAIGVSNSVRAGSATWDLNPSSADWNTAVNWTPTTVPNGLADTATFGLSNTTNVSLSTNTEVNSITFTPAATSPYTITANPGFTLTISGVGIVNNSGTTQNFVTDANFFPQTASRQIFFRGSATAGSLTRFVNRGTQGVATPGGGTVFYGTSSASNGFFVNEASSTPNHGGGQTLFYNNSSAANGTFTNNGGVVVGGYGAETIFSDSSTAGNGTFTNNAGAVSASSSFPSSLGGITIFRDTSTAANAVFTNNGPAVNNASGGGTWFFNTSTAANGTFINNGAGAISTDQGFNAFGGLTRFFDNATAGNGTFINNGGVVTGADGGITLFLGSAGGASLPVSTTAANGVFVNNGGAVSGARGGKTVFSATSTAASGRFTNNGGTTSGAGGGSTAFAEDSTAGSATLIANGGTNGGDGGTIFFDGRSTLGTARIEIFGNGSLDISGHGAIGLHSLPGMIIDSIEGDGNVFLGANNLKVGSNNIDAIFSCSIRDGGQSGGTGGSLTKIGTGTLHLTGSNTYTGNTNVESGVLQIDGTVKSNTFVRRGAILTGAGNIYGAVTGHGTVSPGDPFGTLTVNSYTQPLGSGRLLIDIAGTSLGQFDVLNVLGNVNSNGYLDPVLLNSFIPSIGDEFTFLNYGSLSGAFKIQNAGIFDNGMERWVVTYHATDAVLTATKNVPDHSSTLLLLTLSLLGLVGLQANLRRS